MAKTTDLIVPPGPPDPDPPTDWGRIITAAAAALIAILTAVNTFVGTWNNRKIADVQVQQEATAGEVEKVRGQTKAVAAKVGAAPADH
jgi:hypothetical protein